ncbi:MAG: hypothetical protein IT423_19460 [Pirellulaceae bacterium]|nr:hypothetical protein [Pirellulaceae bacterium]
MPGLRGKQFDLDTADLTAHDWCRARNWNIGFLVGWFAFFAFALGNLLCDGNWLTFIPTFVMAVIGGVSQLVWLVRMSIWLNGERNS